MKRIRSTSSPKERSTSTNLSDHADLRGGKSDPVSLVERILHTKGEISERLIEFGYRSGLLAEYGAAVMINLFHSITRCSFPVRLPFRITRRWPNAAFELGGVGHFEHHNVVAVFSRPFFDVRDGAEYAADGDRRGRPSRGNPSCSGFPSASCVGPDEEEVEDDEVRRNMGTSARRPLRGAGLANAVGQSQSS